MEHHGRVIRIGTVQIAQINGDSCFLTADPGTYKYLATAIDYFSKCTKDEPLQDKLPKSVEVFDWIHQTFMCIRTNQCLRQGICQSGKWGNTLTGDRQQFSRTHNPRASKLVKWQNWTVKDKSLKVERECLHYVLLSPATEEQSPENFFYLNLCCIKNVNNLLIYISNSVTVSL